MKPNLVDESILEMIKPKEIISKKTELNVKKTDYPKLIFNIMSLLLVCIGLFVLYQRKKNKEKNKIFYDKKVKNLQKEINIYENLLKI
jgi:hypothetical protein